MSVSLSDFLHSLWSSKLLAFTALLTLGVVVVNGWTDAPNAIVTCISTRSMKPRAAIIMAAVFNFLGVLVMTAFNSTVAQTIYKMVDFGEEAYIALIAQCAALFAIVLWATAAWWFGIPTSESHALIAGISGAALAVQGGVSGINPAEWRKVLYGLGLSTTMGFSLGWLVVKVVNGIFRGSDQREMLEVFKKAQIAGAAGMAFMHGAQDGQKFIALFMLGIFLAQEQMNVTRFHVPLWLMILCSIVMGLGTSIGGMRIIKSVGMDMVKLDKAQGFSADLAAIVCLLMASMAGIPVSTTHTKTTAIMGVGAAKGFSSVNWRIVRDMVLAWVLTFPGCGLIGYFMAKIFLGLF
ncbi:MAG TPA: inorganic phosphate transporter [Firmicutes bacterium]|nr:inorganic phosphate transporter [Bacillota bacterium]